MTVDPYTLTLGDRIAGLECKVEDLTEGFKQLEVKADAFETALKLLSEIVGILIENLETRANTEAVLVEDIKHIIDEVEAANDE